MFNLQFSEIVIILGLALIFLGPQKLPGLAKSIGKVLRELRSTTDDLRESFERETDFARESVEELKEEIMTPAREALIDQRDEQGAEAEGAGEAGGDGER